MPPYQLVQQGFIQAVAQQLASHDPPQVGQTYARLVQAGYTDQDARRLIAACIACETAAMIDEDRAFNQATYLSYLEHLPKLPTPLTE